MSGALSAAQTAFSRGQAFLFSSNSTEFISRVTIGDHRHLISEHKNKKNPSWMQRRLTYLASLRARSWHHNWIRWLGRNVCAICLLVCGPRAGIRMLPGKLQLWTRGGITSASLGCWYIMNRTGPFSASEKTSRLDDSGGWIKKK